MTRIRWLAVLTVVLIATGVAVPARPALAHGGDGGPVTSNYRTTITEIAPPIEGLTVRIVDIEGTIQLSWDGLGELTALGYEGEPYLRFSDRGVERNINSPATYLNQDRYGQVDPPANASAEATPEWEQVSDIPVAQWHDHRTHWMSTQPPPQVVEDDTSPHVIFDRWEIPIDVAGDPGVIAGTLVWQPPPPIFPWLAAGLLLTAVFTAAMFTRWWRTIAVLLGAVGTIALGVDTLGYVRAGNDTLANEMWAFNYTVASGLATIMLAVHAHRRTSHPTIAMVVAGLVLTVMGGLDRLDAITNSQVFSTMPTTVSRTAPVLCLATGIALSVRFAAFLIPLVVHPESARETLYAEANEP